MSHTPVPACSPFWGCLPARQLTTPQHSSLPPSFLGQLRSPRPLARCHPDHTLMRVSESGNVPRSPRQEPALYTTAWFLTPGYAPSTRKPCHTHSHIHPQSRSRTDTRTVTCTHILSLIPPNTHIHPHCVTHAHTSHPHIYTHNHTHTHTSYSHIQPK